MAPKQRVQDTSANQTVIVVPCYNEAERLPRDEFLSFLRSCDNVLFMFVNDGSTDGTQQMLESTQKACPTKIRVLNLAVNQGKAEAVRKGMLRGCELKAAYVGFWDADLATPLDVIQEFKDILESTPRIQMVFGARVALLGRHIKRKLSRHYLGRIFATLASVVLDLAIYDTQCGAKLFRVTPELQTVVSEPFQTRWIFDVELIARYVALRKADQATPQADEIIYEFPLKRWIDVAGSKLKFRDNFAALLGLVKIAFLYRFRKWPRDG